jgi:exodeoxyribonuclease VII large subunit
MDDMVFRLAQAQSRILKNNSRRLDDLEGHLRRHDLRVRAGVMRRQLDSRAADLNSAMKRVLAGRDTEVNRLTVAIARAGETVLLRRRSHWERVYSNLQALSPKAILDRGYALVFDAKGQLVKQAAQLRPGEPVRAQLGRGAFTAKIEKVDAGDTE